MSKRIILEVGKVIGGDWYVAIPVRDRDGPATATISYETEQELWDYLGAYKMPSFVLERLQELENAE